MNSIFSYPKWEDIPNIDLYLDQVLLYVNQVCAPISPDKDKGLTASMVNNYVKHGYLTKPDKKKYQRKQIARLIAITTLKSVFSIQEIAQKTFGNVYQTEIDASKGIFVPRGVANGFQVLSDTVSYSYLVNDYWALELKPKYAFVNYADPALGIQWENLAEAEVSEADKHHPLLKDVKPLRKEDL